MYTDMVNETNKLYNSSPISDPVDNFLNLNWDNKLAIERVYRSILYLGSPDVVGYNKNQSVIWYNPLMKTTNNYYDKIEIKDQEYHYLQPIKRGDFYFVSYRMDIKPDKIHGLYQINSSASYYPRGPIVTVGCHYMGAALATFSVLKDYNNDKITILQAKKELQDRESKLYNEFNANETKYMAILEKYIGSEKYISTESNLEKTDNINKRLSSITPSTVLPLPISQLKDISTKSSSVLTEQEILDKLQNSSIDLPVIPLPTESLGIQGKVPETNEQEMLQRSPEPVRVPKNLKLQRSKSILDLNL